MLVAAILLNLGGWQATVRLFDRMSSRLTFVKFVGVRHLRGRKSGFLTAISLLAILGVSFSSCTLTTVLSVMGGFSGDLKEKILQSNAHIVVDNTGSDLENWQPHLEAIRQIDGVKAATPVVQGGMMMNARTSNSPILLKGIEPKSFVQVSDVLSNLEKGELDFLDQPEELFDQIRRRRERLYGLGNPADAVKPPDPDPDPKPTFAAPVPANPKRRVLPAVIVGRELAKSLRLYLGEEVNIVAPLGDIGPTGPIPKSRPFRIGGIFFSGMYQFDVEYVYVSIKSAQKFLRKDNRISEIQVAVVDPDRAEVIANQLSQQVGSGLRVRSWKEMNARLFAALKLEKIVMFIFLSLAILVASFCILATLTMLVLEKGSEISVLLTLGASYRSVQNIFRFEGLLIGLVGTISGLAVGFGLCMVLEKVGLPIDPEVWYIDKLPVQMVWSEFLLVGLAAIGITQLATLYPAHAAAQLTPVEGLKNGR